MSTHAHFMDAIRAKFLDPTPRLIYADWLEEQGDQRAEYLRFECAFQAGEIGGADKDFSQQVRRMGDLLQTVDREWLLRVGYRFDLVIQSFSETDDGWQTAKEVVKRFYAAEGMVVGSHPLGLLKDAIWYDVMAVKTEFAKRQSNLELVIDRAGAHVAVHEAGWGRRQIVCIQNFPGSEERLRTIQAQLIRWSFSTDWQYSISQDIYFQTFTIPARGRSVAKRLDGRLGADVKVWSQPALEFALQTEFTPILEGFFGDTHWTW